MIESRCIPSHFVDGLPSANLDGCWHYKCSNIKVKMTVTEAYKIQVNVTGLMRLSVQNVEQILYGRFSLEELV